MKTAVTLAIALALMVFAMLGLSRPAHASPLKCAERAVIVITLHDQFGETSRAMGLEDRGGMVELFASDAGTWTLIASGPDGMSCIVAAGVNFRIEKPGELG